MSQAVSRQPFKAEALVQSQESASEVCCTQIGAETSCAPITSVCLSIIPSTLQPRSVVCYDAGWRLRNGGLIAGRKRIL
jgi:hypothetical protein